jgi:hypothetical protein
MFSLNTLCFEDGGAVYVRSSISVVTLRVDAFFNCRTGREGETRYSGACAYLQEVLPGSSAVDCCATKCSAAVGSFVFFESSVEVSVTGLVAFDCKSAYGALCDYGVRAAISTCNFTSLNGQWDDSRTASAVCQSKTDSSTNARFVLIEDGAGAAALFVESGHAARLRECLFVNCAGAVGHSQTAGVALYVFDACFFAATTLIGTEFFGGTVTLIDCLFVGEVPTMPNGFRTAGVQVGFVGTRIDLASLSLLETCPRQGAAAFTEMARPTARSGLTGGAIAGICIAAVVVVVALIIIVIIICKVLRRKGRDSGEDDEGVNVSEEEEPPREESVADGTRDARIPVSRKDVLVLALDLSNANHIGCSTSTSWISELRHVSSTIGNSMAMGEGARVLKFTTAPAIVGVFGGLGLEPGLALYEGGPNVASELSGFMGYSEPDQMLEWFAAGRQTGLYQRAYKRVSVDGSNHTSGLPKGGYGVFFGTIPLAFFAFGQWCARVAQLFCAEILEIHLNVCAKLAYLEEIIRGVKSVFAGDQTRQAVVTGPVNKIGSPSLVMPSVSHAWLHPNMQLDDLMQKALKRPIQSYHHQSVVFARQWVQGQPRVVPLRDMIAYAAGLERARWLRLLPKILKARATAQQLHGELAAAPVRGGDEHAIRLRAHQLKDAAILVGAFAGLVADVIDPPVMTAVCTNDRLLDLSANEGTGGWNEDVYAEMLRVERERAPEDFAAAERSVTESGFAAKQRAKAERQCRRGVTPDPLGTPPPSFNLRLRALHDIGEGMFADGGHDETSLPGTDGDHDEASLPSAGGGAGAIDENVQREERLMTELVKVCRQGFRVPRRAIELIGCHNEARAAEVREAAHEAVGSLWPLPSRAAPELWWLIDGLAVLALDFQTNIRSLIEDALARSEDLDCE